MTDAEGDRQPAPSTASGCPWPGGFVVGGLGLAEVAPLLTYRRWLPKAEPTTLLRSVAQRNACKG